MIYGKYPDPAAKNRSISRKGTLKAQNASIAKKLITCTDYRKLELQENIDICTKNKKPTQSFASFFWQSEHFTFQRPEYFTSVRMYSTRNDNMEVPYNGEGLLNHYRGDGVNHISITGQECADIWPVYDWQKIPGATILQKPELIPEVGIQKSGLTDFVGAVTDGTYGAAAFDFISPHDHIQAKKSWFFFDDIYACLGSSITSKSEFPVATTLNQCLLNGNVTVWNADEKTLINNGEHALEKVSRIFHDGIGYVFSKPATVHLKNNQSTGSWYNINRQSSTSKEKISLDVFKLWLDHGARPKNASYEYFVLPATTIDKVETQPEKQIIVLENSSNIQAVKHIKQQIYQIVFYKAGELQLEEMMYLTSESPGIYMIKTDGNKPIEITVSDPNRELSKLHFSLTSQLNVKCDGVESNWDADKKQTELIVNLPKDAYAGKSVVIKL